MFKRICKITFITHGATINTQEGIISNSLKFPKLNDYGKEEIRRVCEYLEKRGVAYDNIYSSPYSFCTESAHIIAKLFHKKSTIIDLLNRNYGDWQGTQFDEIYEKYGITGFAKTPKNGETIKHLNKRVDKIVQKLIQENKGNRIIIVTTPDVIKSVLANTLELTPENQYKILIKTGSLTQISYFEGWASVIYSDYKPL